MNNETDKRRKPKTRNTIYQFGSKGKHYVKYDDFWDSRRIINVFILDGTTAILWPSTALKAKIHAIDGSTGM